VLGLDAVSWDVVERLEAEMPHLTALRAQASAGVLESTSPPLTPVAWTSMVTGMSPGHHGVYEFFHRTDTGWLPVSRRQCQAPALDEILEQAGRRSILINLPLSTPRRTSALLLADFLARGDEPVQPAALADECEALQNYRAFWDPAPFAARSVDEAAAEVAEIEAARFEAARYLLTRKDWDYAFYGITGTDHLQHRALNLLLEAPEAPESVLRFYRQVDSIIGWAAAQMGPDDLLLIAADHGSAVSDRYEAPFPFAGRVERVDIELLRPGTVDDREQALADERAAMGRQ
jgi:predicted AlkP superfamily phosphohydrolase/phosphomutase